MFWNDTGFRAIAVRLDHFQRTAAAAAGALLTERSRLSSSQLPSKLTRASALP